MAKQASRPSGGVKLADVARLAGVSTATVSRALSSPDRVGADLLRRVEAAVRESGYVLDGAARALRSGRTRTVGAAVPTLDNAIFANATHALQKALEQKGYTLLVASHEFDLENEVRVVRPLVERGIDALVLVGLDHTPELFQLLDAVRLPYVLTWALDRTGGRPCIGFDNRAAAARVADYVADLGHRRVAMIGGLSADNDRARDRIAGTLEALRRRGVTVPPAWVLERPYTFDAARAAMRVLMREQPRPTVVICGNDVLAIGALAEARALGLHVPADVSVTGFDDLEIAALLEPPLTTVRVPSSDIGRLAAARVLDTLSGGEGERVREVPVELVVRRSTAPPPAGPAQ
ncbi:MAG: LacI family DNA-binding transcriptional regulator [Pseudomonadota bacterium]